MTTLQISRDSYIIPTDFAAPKEKWPSSIFFFFIQQDFNSLKKSLNLHKCNTIVANAKD